MARLGDRCTPSVTTLLLQFSDISIFLNSWVGQQMSDVHIPAYDHEQQLRLTIFAEHSNFIYQIILALLNASMNS